MKDNMGLWIDHRKAVIVNLRNKGEEIHEILSNMEKQVRFSGGAQETSADDQRNNRFKGHLNKYYDTVALYMRNAASILILGPGEAKTEFRARLEFKALNGRIAGIETTDKMTVRQVVAKVRKHFFNAVKETDRSNKH